MYTSGCPKNQKRCCHNSAWPPATGSKKCVPIAWSNINMIAAPCSTGSANTPRMAVMNSAQTDSGIRNQVMPGARWLMIVVM